MPLLVTTRLWRQFASWFKSSNGQCATARREQCKRRRRTFSLEQFEPRQLLASDIALTEFGATGTHLVVSYDIAEEIAPAFNVSVYRSTDGVSRDALLASRDVTFEEERTVGRHTIEFGADFDDVRDDYKLIAVVDPTNSVAESSEENNQIAFRGGAFLTPDGTLHVHGGDSAERVRIDPSAASGATGSASEITVKIDEWMMEYESASVNEIHVRLHGGDDVLQVQPQVAHNIQVHGGDGNDRILSGAGSDWLVGGFGDDFIAGRGNRDLIDGGDGDDTLLGGTGQDTLVGTAGNDKLLGGRGRDIVAGGEGRDIVDGGDDDDLAWGGKGADRIVNLVGANEARDAKADDTLLAATPEELIFAELSAEDEGASQQTAASTRGSAVKGSNAKEDTSVGVMSETYGYNGTAGPFWMEPDSGPWMDPEDAIIAYHPEEEGWEWLPFRIYREDATWGPTVTFQLAYAGTATDADFLNRETSVTIGPYVESIEIDVFKDAMLEGTESFTAYFASGEVVPDSGEYIIIDYPSSGPSATDPDLDPSSETAYIVDGDLTWYDALGTGMTEYNEESPGGFMEVGVFHPLDVMTLGAPDGGYFSLHYPPQIAVWLDGNRSQALPSGGTIPQNSMVLYIEAVAPVLGADVPLAITLAA